ncbi:transcriptional regulator, XRE family [Archaeoglobus sulfaticallidus PM70-1]|uniref:Transcriptional regulator, XRE family n=1 Tax=Archaeoglobus sulfaticallidus PM70-1 TaxID=387631 RepID=N0BEA0_9EURY|nr:multiprotein bridging factor aMBF1 [Archaeoglobus sulfaticallidus]AGK60552.1 transcriptional regulator, XRE family [Archaeoglobus sulfaticallidus PM70-1]
MECEVCGAELRGKPFKVIIEGSEVNVCKRCKSLGSEKPVERISQKDVKKVFLRKKSPRKKIEFEEELLENYNLIIKREREKRGWSQEVLAKKIQEKESLIRKIENAEITPETEVIEKLERLFNIKLREKVVEVKVNLNRKSLTPTLGDIVVIKKKKS